MLTGDLYHYPEELTREGVPPGEFDAAQSAASRKAVKAFVDRTGTKMWIGHDLTGFATLRKAPEFYE